MFIFEMTQPLEQLPEYNLVKRCQNMSFSWRKCTFLKNLTEMSKLIVSNAGFFKGTLCSAIYWSTERKITWCMGLAVWNYQIQIRPRYPIWYYIWKQFCQDFYKKTSKFRLWRLINVRVYSLPGFFIINCHKNSSSLLN